MAANGILQNHRIKFKETVNKTENGFNLALLAMMTAFDIKLRINEINLNLKRLFVELNLPIRKNFSNKIHSCLSSLLLKGYIRHRGSSYVISEKGKTVGFQALLHFRQNTGFLKN
jgi:hypothetical protein